MKLPCDRLDRSTDARRIVTRRSRRCAAGVLWAAIVLGSVDAGVAAPPLPTALFSPAPVSEWLAHPYPSDDLRSAEGTVDLARAGFPVHAWPIARGLMEGWIAQVRGHARGFPAVGPIYFCLDGPPAEGTLAEQYAGDASDPVRVLSLDSGHRVPLHVRFVAGAGDDADPWLPPNLLVLMPDPAKPLRGGERYAAVIDDTIVRRPAGWTPPAALAADDAARAGIATVFTVQDSMAALRALRDAVDAALRSRPELLEPRAPGMRSVVALSISQGKTPRDEDPATLQRVRFADGVEAVSYLDDRPGRGPQKLDLVRGPYEVFEAEIKTLVAQPDEGRPYQEPGWRALFDDGRSDGAIPFDGAGRLMAAPHEARLRVVVQIPRKTDVSPPPPFTVVLWLHGSGSDAYDAVARIDPAEADGIASIRATLAQTGAVIVSADLPHFGRRFPLTEKGYGSDQGFVNVPNLVAMRDTARSAAAETRVLWHFATETLPALLREKAGAEIIDARAVAAFGHSTGAQVWGLGGAMAEGRGPRAFLLSGAGGFLADYVVSTRLLEMPLRFSTPFGVIDRGTLAPRDVLGLAFRVPYAARARIDRWHPMLLPYALMQSGADPLSVAPSQTAPAAVVYSAGDRRVSEDSARALAAALPLGHLLECTPTADYDAHHCIYRERPTLLAFIDLIHSAERGRIK